MSTPEPVFSRDAATALYWLDQSTAPVGFLSSQPDDLGQNPTLSQTWSDSGGVYLFLGGAAKPPDFLTSLNTYLALLPLPWPRYLWIYNPDQPALSWSVQSLYLTQDSPNVWRIDQRVDFPLADYTLIVRDGSTVAPGEDAAAGWGFQLGDSESAPAISLFAPDGTLAARTGSAILSMAPVSAGGWRFILDAAPPAGDADVFAQLGCGIRYFTAGDEGAVNAVRFTALRQPATVQLSLYATLDPIRPFHRERSALGFFPWTPAGAAPALHSGYATARGYGVDLTPQPAVDGGGTPARLVFAFAPYYVGETGDVAGGYYFALDGPFGLTVVPPKAAMAGDIERLLCGASGLEYLGVPQASACSLIFVPDQPAYAPLSSTADGAQSLSRLGTTSWVYMQAPVQANVHYFAQPEDAPLFRAPEAMAADTPPHIDLLDFLEVVASNLPAPGPDRAFPMAPFRDLDPSMLNDALAIEQRALAPRRRIALEQIGIAARGGPMRTPRGTPTAKVGVSPQGLGVGIAADDETWTWLGIGHTGAPAREPDLRFTTVDGRFREAMLTNNLFMVLGNPGVFGQFGSVAYQLTKYALDVIATLPEKQRVPPDVLADVLAFMTQKKFPRYDTLTDFQQALQQAHSGITAAQMLVFQRFAGQLTAVVQGWPFRLSPDNWVNPLRRTGANSYLLFKFVLGRSLATLAGDISTWAWPEAASNTGKPVDAQGEIGGIIAAAREAVKQAPDTSPYRHFVQVVDDPYWTGVLALSVDVPLDGLPDQLQVLAAGIDASAFHAHHMGMSATPYSLSGGALQFSRSSLFGLIDYQNLEDQYFSENIPFAFRVLQLTVGIENSVITTFSSRVELLVNRLFGAPARLFPTEHGNNVILNGAYQKQRMPDGTEHDGYVFSMAGHNSFQIDGLILQTVDVLSTQMITSKPADPSTGDATVDATFQMAGDLRFYEPEHFDPFCWGPAATAEESGYLRFGNLGIGMSFSMGDPAGTTVFTLKDGNLSFDMANSKARPNALVSRFPLRLSGLIATTDPALSSAPAPPNPPTPADMGYVSVTAPIDQSVLSQPWYGLNYTIDLGTLGALANNTAIAIQVLVAWSPGTAGTTPSVYFGVKLPGTKDTFGVSLPLQGIIKLGFRSIEFLVDNQPGLPRTYTLRMRDFAIRLLGLSFPPGYNDVILFGNPDQSGSSKIGWYAAYASDADPKKQTGAPTREMLARSQQLVRQSEES
jgi:hypothetical protein